MFLVVLGLVNDDGDNDDDDDGNNDIDEFLLRIEDSLPAVFLFVVKESSASRLSPEWRRRTLLLPLLLLFDVELRRFFCGLHITTTTKSTIVVNYSVLTNEHSKST